MSSFLKVFKDPGSITEKVKIDISEALSGGLHLLEKSSITQLSDIHEKVTGNYIISSSSLCYTGQSEDVKKRLSWHLDKKSPVYNKFTKRLNKDLVSTDFDLRYIPVLIGKKELEEFAIANLPAELNMSNKKAHVPYHWKFKQGCIDEWQEIQKNKKAILESMKTEIDNIDFIQWGKAVDIVKGFNKLRGIYIVCDSKENILYVGESYRLWARYNDHSKRTRSSIIRRNYATEENMTFMTRKELGTTLKVGKNKGKESDDSKSWYLSDCDNEKVSKYIASCKIKLIAVPFGRYELERHLVEKLKPRYNKR